ncbi:MAG: zf-TFIIB domain-containing protein [Planctomycetota bacterium]
MDCPRCHLPLRKTDYVGVEAEICEQCWGFWLDRGELEQILAADKMQFDEKERATVLSVRTASLTGPREPVRCPKCSRMMARLHYDASVHIVLDECPAHGIWLDTGEIKKVQAVAAKSADIHRMLIRKLGLG